MSSIEPKSMILSLVKSVPKGLEAKAKTPGIAEKAEAVAEVLKKNPDLASDREIVKAVLDLTEGSKDHTTREFRNKILFDACCKEESGIITLEIPEFVSKQEKAKLFHACPSEKGKFDVERGVLTLSRDSMKQMDAKGLWQFVKDHHVQKLIIQAEKGEIIEYNEAVLEQFEEKQPSLDALTEKWEILFYGGGELIETKANLLLCGHYFEGLFHLPMIKESASKSVDFSESDVTLEGFSAILHRVETGFEDQDVDKKLYQAAVSHLQFTEPVQRNPKNVFGVEKWLHFYGAEQLQKMGIDLRDVPPVPKELLAELEKPSPFFEGKTVAGTSKLFLMPKGLTINKMGELAKNPAKGGNKLTEGYDRFGYDFLELYGDQPVEQSHWLLMTTDTLPNSRSKSRDQLLDLASSVEHYQAPSLLEAIVCIYSEYVESKKRLFGDSPSTLTCCREELLKGSMIAVGGFTSVGLRAIESLARHTAYKDLGVAAVFRK